MPNTYTQLYVHIVFTVQGRRCLLSERWREEVFKYITGIVKHRGQKLLAINGVVDHVHMLVGMTPSIALSDLIRDVKAGSSGFINEKPWVAGKFNWQEGFGAFTHSRHEIDGVVRYIKNQQDHHRRTTFKEEYLQMLQEFSVIYDNRYLFKWIEDEQATPEGV